MSLQVPDLYQPPGVWYKHSGDASYYELDKFKTGKTLEELTAELGDHHITHLCIEGKVPQSLKSFPPLLTELKLHNILDKAALEKLLKEESFKSLTSLRKLDVAKNYFSSRLTACLTEIASLEELNLSHCHVKDLPLSLKSLTKLRQLEVSGNDFSAGLPACLTELTSLEKLNLSSCKLSDLPSSLRNLQHLESINLSQNIFRSLPAVVCELKKLKVLSLGSYIAPNDTLETLDSGLLQMENLITIDCFNCQALTSPPYAVCQQGEAAIKKYYRDCGVAQSLELPVIMVAVIGKSMSGKTSLIRSLQGNKRELTYRDKISELDEATRVFQINKVELTKSYLRFVDFGGNEVYQMSYQMALKDHCIPLIVVNMKEYADVSTLTNPLEACKIVCFDWMSHFYLACPRLGHPILVLTHKDKFSNERFEVLVAELLKSVEVHREELLEEEKSLFGDSGDFCRILHLSDTSKPVFNKDNIFEFGNDLNELSNIQALKASLENYCQQFNVAIPLSWELMGKLFDEKQDKENPFLQLSEIQKKFPGEEQLIILRYMHNIGRVLWYENEPTLQQYVFHQISELTNMVSLLFHHSRSDQWKQRVAKFRPFRYLQRSIEKEKYEELVNEFTLSGIIDEAILFNLFDKRTGIPADIALAVLRAFCLLHGPISHPLKNVYVIPQFSAKCKDESFAGDGYLQLKVSITFKGLPLPQYVYELMTVVLLNMYTDSTSCKDAANNGATIQHGESTTHLVHNSSKRKVTIQLSTSLKELSLSWQRLAETCKHVRDTTIKTWKATRPEVIFYCAHCLYMRDPAPGWDVDPDWLHHTIPPHPLMPHSHKFNAQEGYQHHSGVNLVKCCKNKYSVNPPNMPAALRFPCAELNEKKLEQLQSYLENCRLPTYSLPADQPHDSVEEPVSDVSDDLNYLDASDESIDLINLQIKPCVNADIKNLFTSESVYTMSKPNRGRCLVINNLNFDPLASTRQQVSDTRHGSEMDVANISKVFKDLSFEIDIQTDLSSQELDNVIINETKHKNHTKYGMFVLVIMSHGAENKVYGKDKQTISLTTIYDRLSSYNFPAMAGKPKVIIIQACSGERRDTKGQTVSDAFPAGNGSGAMSSLPPQVKKPRPGEYLATDDLYIMKASFLGYVALRHTRSGTWFVRALVEALYKHACHRDLQSLFQQVKNKVRKMSLKTPGVSGQQPTDECTFRDGKKLYLFPGYNPPV